MPPGPRIVVGNTVVEDPLDEVTLISRLWKADTPRVHGCVEKKLRALLV